jgi:hypothetical protein
MLVGTGRSLVDVALSVGFQTQSHFTSVFKRYAGRRPRAWRESHGVQYFAQPVILADVQIKKPTCDLGKVICALGSRFPLLAVRDVHARHLLVEIAQLFKTGRRQSEIQRALKQLDFLTAFCLAGEVALRQACQP